MVDKNELVARLANGESMDDLMKEISDEVNSAVAEKEEQEKKTAAAQSIVDSINSYYAVDPPMTQTDLENMVATFLDTRNIVNKLADPDYSFADLFKSIFS